MYRGPKLLCWPLVGIMNAYKYAYEYTEIMLTLTLTSSVNKAGYTATPVACGWAGAIFEVSGAFGQEPHGLK